MKRICSLLLAMVLALALTVPAFAATAFTDIPSGSTLAEEIEKANSLGLMEGYNSTTFGYYQNITRAQFAAVLVRMFGWTLDSSTKQSFTDVPAAHYWHAYIETAVSHDVADAGGAFRPSAAITRSEMAEMLVRALGYKSVAQNLNANSAIPQSDLWNGTPFTDLPMGNEGYIGVAYAIGMTNGITATTFAPNNKATRAQAAAMLVRIYEKYNHSTDFTHGFYAISSYSQIGLTSDLDAVSAGWSRMTWDGTTALLSTTSANGNEYCVPSGYSSLTAPLASSGKPLNLSVYMEGSSLMSMLSTADGRTQAIDQIINELTISYKAIGKNPYAGVTIDFEGLRNAQKANFTAFLTELASQVHALGKTLYVTVQPVLTTGSYYDGYDYKAIGNLADRVILMAHDYDPTSLSGYEGTTYYKNAALTPIGQVYESLRAITDASTGVQDSSKIVLALSSKAVAWQTDEAGKLTSASPIQVDSATVYKRLSQSSTTHSYSTNYDNAYATYTDENGQHYFLWYECTQSVAAKVKLAKLFGINSVSLWRLGTIPTYSDVGFDWMSAIQ
ncbi:MAG: S-layer homology domain-containing protein [Oscillibacter sp.]|nr:S-layer homology domain-containing protein [Oscillibacter sp.]